MDNMDIVMGEDTRSVTAEPLRLLFSETKTDDDRKAIAAEHGLEVIGLDDTSSPYYMVRLLTEVGESASDTLSTLDSGAKDFDLQRMANGLVFTKQGNTVVCASYNIVANVKNFGDIASYHGETDNIDDYEISELYDGTQLKLYYHNNWRLSTSRRIDANTAVWSSTDSYRSLFEQTFANGAFDYRKLDRANAYTFIMVHPRNIMVMPYRRPALILAGVHSVSNLSEINPEDDSYMKQLPVASHADIHPAKGTQIGNPIVCRPTRLSDIRTVDDLNNRLRDDTQIAGVILKSRKTGQRYKMYSAAYLDSREIRGGNSINVLSALVNAVPGGSDEYRRKIASMMDTLPSPFNTGIVPSAAIVDEAVRSAWNYWKLMGKQHPLLGEECPQTKEEIRARLLKSCQDEIIIAIACDHKRFTHSHSRAFAINCDDSITASIIKTKMPIRISDIITRLESNECQFTVRYVEALAKKAYFVHIQSIISSGHIQSEWIDYIIEVCAERGVEGKLEQLLDNRPANKPLDYDRLARILIKRNDTAALTILMKVMPDDKDLSEETLKYASTQRNPALLAIVKGEPVPKLTESRSGGGWTTRGRSTDNWANKPDEGWSSRGRSNEGRGRSNEGWSNRGRSNEGWSSRGRSDDDGWSTRGGSRGRGRGGSGRGGHNTRH